MPVDRKFHPRVGDSEKIAKLTDMEFRVWFTYIMVADDFGVLPLVAAKIKAGDRTLANRKPAQIARALETLVDIGLVRRFEHQGSAYIWSPNWQEHQEIRYPRREQTHYPAPPEDQIEGLTGSDQRSTRELFATFHMKVSGTIRDRYGNPEAIRAIQDRDAKRATSKPRRSRDIPDPIPATSPQRSGTVAETFPQHSGDVATLTRARAPETANGLRLTANGSEGVQGEPPFAPDASPGDTARPPIDLWARELSQRLYPPQGRCGWNIIEQPLYGVLTSDPAVSPAEAWAALKARLEALKRSHRWTTKPEMVPRLDRWLREGLHLQELPADGPAGSVAGIDKRPAWARKAAGQP